MRIVELKFDEFNEYAESHKLGNFYQSSEYSR